jgi:threonine dehydratase
MIPPLDAIRRAREAMAPAIVRTPLLRFHAPGSPVRIFLKLENLQPIGSFKIRGASNAMSRLTPGALARGVWTTSAGNMAQGVAWRAGELGIPCTVVAPETAPRAKLDAIGRLGARVITVPFEVWWRSLEERTYPGIEGTFIHPCDDPDVMAGNGTIGLEILEDLPDVDAVVIPWGGGGLTCGIAAAVRSLRPRCRIFAAEVATAAPLSASLAAGRAVTIDYRPTFVDGIGGRTVLPGPFESARSLIDGAVVASVDEVAEAVRLLVRHARVVAEGAGACPVAGALAGRAGTGNVTCVVSGGNIDPGTLAEILTGGPGPGREAT